MLVIIKVGGSVITDKSKPYPSLRKSALSNIADSLKHFIDVTGMKVVLIHGAGSYAHPLAAKWVKERDKEVKNALIAQIQHNLLRLSLKVINALEQEGIKAIYFSPPALFRYMRNKQISSVALDVIVKWVEQGFVPVLHGSMVASQNEDFSVLSGDDIAVFLANELNAKMVFFATDVEGIYNKDPKVYKDAILLRQVDRENLKNLLFKDDKKVRLSLDVTGAMHNKIKAILNLRSVEKVFLFSGFEKDCFKKAYESKIGSIFSLND